MTEFNWWDEEDTFEADKETIVAETPKLAVLQISENYVENDGPGEYDLVIYIQDGIKVTKWSVLTEYKMIYHIQEY